MTKEDIIHAVRVAGCEIFEMTILRDAFGYQRAVEHHFIDKLKTEMENARIGIGSPTYAHHDSHVLLYDDDPDSGIGQLIRLSRRVIEGDSLTGPPGEVRQPIDCEMLRVAGEAVSEWMRKVGWRKKAG